MHFTHWTRAWFLTTDYLYTWFSLSAQKSIISGWVVLFPAHFFWIGRFLTRCKNSLSVSVNQIGRWMRFFFNDFNPRPSNGNIGKGKEEKTPSRRGIFEKWNQQNACCYRAALCVVEILKDLDLDMKTLLKKSLSTLSGQRLMEPEHMWNRRLKIGCIVLCWAPRER